MWTSGIIHKQNARKDKVAQGKNWKIRIHSTETNKQAPMSPCTQEKLTKMCDFFSLFRKYLYKILMLPSCLFSFKLWYENVWERSGEKKQRQSASQMPKQMNELHCEHTADRCFFHSVAGVFCSAVKCTKSFSFPEKRIIATANDTDINFSFSAGASIVRLPDTNSDIHVLAVWSPRFFHQYFHHFSWVWSCCCFYCW